jgi:hypothetical protein
LSKISYKKAMYQKNIFHSKKRFKLEVGLRLEYQLLRLSRDYSPYQVNSKCYCCSEENPGKQAASTTGEETWLPQVCFLQDDREAEAFHYKEPLQNSMRSETGSPQF